MRISDWSSDVCSSDLRASAAMVSMPDASSFFTWPRVILATWNRLSWLVKTASQWSAHRHSEQSAQGIGRVGTGEATKASSLRSEEHTSELQSLMRISYAVFCLKKKHTHFNIS